MQSRKSAWIFYPFDTPENEVARAKAAGVDTIIPKGADGRNLGDSVGSTCFVDHVKALIPVAQAAGLQVWPYCYIYFGPAGYDPENTPEGEAAAVRQLLSIPGVAGVFLDSEYESVNRMDGARRFFAALGPAANLAFTTDFRLLVGNAFAPWSAGSVNLTTEPFPWAELLEGCEVIGPQLYFTDFALAPSDVIAPLLSVFQNAVQTQGWPERDVIPILPGDASPADFRAGIADALEAGCDSVSVWRLDTMSDELCTILREAQMPEPQKAFSVGEGVQNAMKANMDTPLGDEKYVGDWMSITPGGKGLYVYVKQANRTYFLKAA